MLSIHLFRFPRAYRKGHELDVDCTIPNHFRLSRNVAVCWSQIGNRSRFDRQTFVTRFSGKLSDSTCIKSRCTAFHSVHPPMDQRSWNNSEICTSLTENWKASTDSQPPEKLPHATERQEHAGSEGRASRMRSVAEGSLSFLRQAVARCKGRRDVDKMNTEVLC